MTEGKVTSWRENPGDTVAVGEGRDRQDRQRCRGEPTPASRGCVLGEVDAVYPVKALIGVYANRYRSRERRDGRGANSSRQKSPSHRCGGRGFRRYRLKSQLLRSPPKPFTRRTAPCNGSCLRRFQPETRPKAGGEKMRPMKPHTDPIRRTEVIWTGLTTRELQERHHRYRQGGAKAGKGRPLKISISPMMS